ncbi:hypothetical protein V8C37DRAFT_413753 [Trichoderma ceciliae]
MPPDNHQFENLPKIRHEIWGYALQPINPTSPRAHVLPVTNYQQDGDILKILRVQCNLGSDCEIKRGYQYCLAAPKFGSIHSEIIEKHYKIEYWTAKLRQDLPVNADACVPFIYPSTGGDWCFPIHPNRDLVCLQPFSANTVGFYRGNEYFSDRGVRGFINLALEYNSSWYDGLERIYDRCYLFREMNKDGSDSVALRKGNLFNGSDKRFSRSALDFVAQLEMLFGGINPAHSCLRHSGIHIG